MNERCSRCGELFDESELSAKERYCSPCYQWELAKERTKAKMILESPRFAELEKAYTDVMIEDMEDDVADIPDPFNE